jgi:hypothetical protein
MLTKRVDVLVGAIVALVIGLLVGYGWGRQMGGAGDLKMADEQAATSTQPAGTQLIGSDQAKVTGTVAEGNSLSVVGQPAGMSVVVRSVTLTEKAWIAIRDQSGSTLGAALVPTGTHADVSIPLLRPTQAGENYQALIYFDDGTKTFDLHTETIVLNPDGSVAGATFDAQ